MNAENQRVLLPFLPVARLDQKAIDVPIVGALVREAFDIGKLQLFPERLVQIRKLAFIAATQICKIQIVQMLEIVDRVNHRMGATVAIDGAYGPWTRGDLRDRFG